MPDNADISLLNVSENATFRVQHNAADQCMVIRVHRHGYHTVREIQSELEWIISLRDGGLVETPAPIETVTGSLLASIGDGEHERCAVAFEFMAGAEPSITSDLAGWFKKLGGITATLHEHSRQWQRPPGFTRKTWNVETMLGVDGFWGDWRNAAGLTQEGRATIGEAVELIEARLNRFGQGSDRYGLIHADLRLANLLVEKGRLGIIDFDDCGYCWFAYDFAAAISFHELDPSIPTLQKAWVEGYREVADFSAEDEAEIPTLVLLRRILLTAWLSTHSETPTGQELGETYTDGTIAMAREFVRGKQA